MTGIGSSTISLQGDLDIATAAAVDARITAALAAGTPHVVIDLSGITFIDCLGLSALLRARRRCGECGASLTLDRPSETVVRLLELTETRRLFRRNEGACQA